MVPVCARIVREGPDAALISSGIGTQWALEAATVLSERGCEASVLHVPVMKPFGWSEVEAFAARFPVVHSVENHSIVGGLGAAVTTVIAERGLATRLVPEGIPDRRGEYGRVDFNRGALGLDAESLARAVL